MIIKNDLINKPLMHDYHKQQTQVEIYYENHHDVVLKSGKQGQAKMQIIFSDVVKKPIKK